MAEDHEIGSADDQDDEGNDDLDLTPYLEYTGAKIAEARSDAGLSQPDVKKALGLSVPTQSVYENGRKTPSLRTIVRYAELFGKPLAHFFSDAPLPKGDEISSSIRMSIMLKAAKLEPVYLELLDELATALLNHDEAKGTTRIRTLLDITSSKD